MRYPLARDGIFRTLQGEGALLGMSMVFVRLAGCSIGCSGGCDTDYAVHTKHDPRDIAARVREVRGNATWIWVTGGEPADHDLWPLLECLRLEGRIALATSGHKPLGVGGRLVNFLSVSPHGKPDSLVLRQGSQINLVEGLNGLDLLDWQKFDPHGFTHHFVTPLYGSTESLTRCIAFVEAYPAWRLNIQAHKYWGLP